MEYVKRLPESQSQQQANLPPPQPMILHQQGTLNNGNGSNVVAADPFHFEPYADEHDSGVLGYDPRHVGVVGPGR